jgi:hypothetical protein
MVVPFTFIEATPVGARTILFLGQCEMTSFRKVLLPVPALPVKKSDSFVSKMSFFAN